MSRQLRIRHASPLDGDVTPQDGPREGMAHPGETGGLHPAPNRVAAWPVCRVCVLSFALLPVSMKPAGAASGQWNGATDSLWATPANWSAAPVPGTGDTATFNSPGNGNTTLSLGGGVTIHTMLFDTVNAAAYTIGSGGIGSETLTLNNGGAITMNAAVAQNQTINAALVLGTDTSASTYTVTNGSPSKKLVLAGNISRNGAANTKTLVSSGTGVGETLISGIIGGGAIAVTKNGGGVLTLSGNNTFTGALTVNGGTLSVPVFNNSNADGPLGHSTAAVTLSRYTALRHTGVTASSTKRLAIEDGYYATVDIADAAAELTLSGIVDGGRLIKEGPGTLGLAVANTQTSLTVETGAVRLSGTGTFGASGSDLEVNGRLDLNGKSASAGYVSGAATGRILNNGTGTSTVTTTFTSYSFSGGVLVVSTGPTFAGVLADNDNGGAGIVALAKSGNGDLGLSGINTYSGTTTISGGSIDVFGNGTLGNAVGGTVVNSGGTLSLSVPSTDEQITIAGSGVTLAGYGPLTSGALQGSGTLTGLLKLGASATVSGTFDITNPGTITGAGFTLTFDAAGNSSIASIIGTTTGGLVKKGTGKLTLTGSNTFTGATAVNEGTLNIQNNTALGTAAGGVTLGTASLSGTLELQGSISVGAEALTMTRGTLRNVSGTNTYGGLITLGAGAPQVISVDSGTLNLTSTGTISGAGNLMLTGSGDGMLAGILGATVLSYTKEGTGTWTLTGANALTGTANVAAGTLKLSGGGKLGASSVDLFLSGGTIDLNGTSQSVGGISSNPGFHILNNGGGQVTFTVGNGGASGYYSGVIADNNNGSGGTVAVAKASTGTIIWSGPNTYSGTTVVSDGILEIDHPGALGSIANGTSVTSGATLRLSGVSITAAEPLTLNGAGDAAAGGALQGMGASSYAGLISLGSASVITASAGATLNLTHTGIITGAGFGLTLTGAGSGSLASVIGTGSGTLTKSGTGKWTLFGANTHSGLTTISAGVLNIQDASALGGTAAGTTISAAGGTLQLEGGISVGAEPLTIRGAGAAGATAALQNVGGDNVFGGLITLGADSTISSDAGTLNLSNIGTITGATFDLTLTGAGDGAIAGILGTTSGTLIKTGSGKWTLTGLSTYAGKTFIRDGTLEITTLKNIGAGNTSSLGVPTTAANGTIDLGSTATTGTLRFTGSADAASNRVLNLAGTTGGATLESSSATNTRLVMISSLTATGLGDKLLTLTGTSTGDNELSGAIVNSTGFKTSVAKTGSGNWKLSGASTYTGNTSVTAGMLTLSNAFLANAADVNLTTGGVLNLAFAGSDTISQLRIDGVVQSPGTWGSPTSAATFKTALIAGSGILNVTSGPALQPYAAWIASFPVTGSDSEFEADPEHDAVANGLEWILGGTPLANSAGVLPQVSGNAASLILTFSRNDASESTSTLLVQWGTAPAVWSDVPVGAASSGPDANGITVTVTENGPAPDSITVAIPRSNEAQGRLFTRLKATMP